MKTLYSLAFVMLAINVTPSSGVLDWLWVDYKIKNVKWTVEKCNDITIPFTKRQRSYCSRYLPYMEFVSKSASEIKHWCRRTFAASKWDCEIILKAPNHFDDSLSTASRELAAVSALASAHLLHTIMSGCRDKGLCLECKDRVEIIPKDAKRVKGEEELDQIVHQSGACDEMFPEPMNFVKRFLKVGRKKMKKLEKLWPAKKAEEEIMFHNRQIGIEIAHQTRSPRCYCRGLFAVCYTKVCYTAMDFFYKAALRVLALYKTARRVRIKKNGKIIPIDDPTREIGKMELMYAEEFDVCATDNGNKLRVCSIDDAEQKETLKMRCDQLCCGKNNYKRVPAIFQWKCNCRFLNGCCKVTCDTCTRDAFRYVCTA